MPFLRPGAPDGSPLSQDDLGAAAASLALLARQPLSQGRHQVVVRELVILGVRRFGPRGEGSGSARRRGFRSQRIVRLPRGGRRHQAKLAVEDTQHVLEIAWSSR